MASKSKAPVKSGGIDNKAAKALVELIVNQNNTLRKNAELISTFGSADSKHQTAWTDYGYKHELCFSDFFEMYRRYGIATAAIDRIVKKTWQTNPVVSSGEKELSGSPWESAVSKIFDRVDFWRRCQGVDRRQRVGQYGGLILIVRDNLTLKDPLPGDLTPESLVDIIPVYQGQLKVSETQTNTTSPDYGEPLSYQFVERLQGEGHATQTRSETIHADRVVIWAEGSDSSSIYGTPALEGCFNSLINMEKIEGAGGEGFWKNARGSLNVDYSKDTDLNQLARSMGTTMADLPDKMSDVIDDFVRGFDKQFMTQGATVTPLSISLPNPKEFYDISLWGVCSCVGIPSTILIGQQTGRMASDEDQSDWAQTVESRRVTFTVPAIRATIDRLIGLGMIPAPPSDYYILWDSLLEPNPSDKLNLGKKMAEINKLMLGTGQPAPFTSEQIAVASGYVFDLGDDLGDDSYDD